MFNPRLMPPSAWHRGTKSDGLFFPLSKSPKQPRDDSAIRKIRPRIPPAELMRSTPHFHLSKRAGPPTHGGEVSLRTGNSSKPFRFTWGGCGFIVLSNKHFQKTGSDCRRHTDPGGGEELFRRFIIFFPPVAFTNPQRVALTTSIQRPGFRGRSA